VGGIDHLPYRPAGRDRCPEDDFLIVAQVFLCDRRRDTVKADAPPCF
jgi:hypothetical protein